MNFDDLSDSERSFLAMHATYRSQQEDDVRYWHHDSVERARLKERWQEIADALDPDPWRQRS